MRTHHLRRLALALVTLAAAIGAGCGGGGDAAGTAVPAAAPGHWVVLGSSTAAGTGAPPGQRWVDLLAQEFAPQQVTVANLARFGQHTAQALSAGSPTGLDAALAQAPALLLLSFPSNDVFAGIGTEASEANLQRMVDAARGQGAAAMLLGRQPRHDLNDAQRAALSELDRRMQARLGTCFVEVYALLAGPGERLDPAVDAGDGIHLNAEGHRRLHAAVSAALRAGGCVRVR
jgi:lysophospholipase L1-like esterase